MFASNVKQTFLRGEQTITEKLFGFEFISDGSVVVNGSLAMGYDCHAPPEPAVIDVIIPVVHGCMWEGFVHCSHLFSLQCTCNITCPCNITIIMKG